MENLTKLKLSDLGISGLSYDWAKMEHHKWYSFKKYDAMKNLSFYKITLEKLIDHIEKNQLELLTTEDHQLNQVYLMVRPINH